MFNNSMENVENIKNCNTCGTILIVGENWYASNKKKLNYSCNKCAHDRRNYLFELIDMSCSTDDEAKWKRIRRLLLSRINQYKKKHGENSCDDPDAIMAHLRQKYTTLPDNCPVLNIKLKYSSSRPKTQDTLYSISIDRIDSNIGYKINNISIISNRANTLKNNSNIREVLGLLLYMRSLNIKEFNELLKEKGLVFFSLNNREKTKTNEEILENGGGDNQIGNVYEQFLLNLINN